jgi:NDP-sugar pyrophosphorylase family protein
VMQCLILAGGLGTRVRGISSELPKALLPVAGRPFADWQLEWLAAEGVESVVYSIGYLGSLIREFVEDGDRWGLKVDYVDEQDTLLGTGGAVRLALDAGVLHKRFFVLYGDSYLRVSVRAVDEAFVASDLPGMMTVFHNHDRWDRSNVEFDGERVLRYAKGAQPSPSMQYIDYGLMEFDRNRLAQLIPPNGRYDLATLLEELSNGGLLGGFEAVDRFFEIGSPDGIRDLDALLSCDRG